ncbi:MAG: RimK family alpha-L-glutamate ligase [Undibacterium sp.]
MSTLGAPHSTSTLSAVIIFTPSPLEERRPFSKPALAAAYTEFFELARKNGVELFRASTRWYSADEQLFRLAWHWDGKNWELKKDVKPDVVFDKAATNSETLPIKKILEKQFPFLNPLAFSLHAGSKLLVSQAFKEFAKPYYLAENQVDLEAAATEIPGAMIVIKPLQGNSGDGVSIQRKEDLGSVEARFPLLVQEFVDSSAGIPDVMIGLHDLRLIYSGEDLVYAYYRTPRAGSYLANLAKGGTQTMLDQESIPQAVWPVVRAVQERYRDFVSKIFTIDLIFDPSGTPWIVELNTMPGLYPDESERPHIYRLYTAIISAMKDIADKRLRL